MPHSTHSTLSGDSAAPAIPLLSEITLRNFLSFGPEMASLPLGPLNLFVGPNGTGKSNLLEALALMRATPVPPRSVGNSDLRGILRRGGGTQAWIWKSKASTPATVELVLAYPDSRQPLRHVLAFAAETEGFRLHDERVEDQSPGRGRGKPYSHYEFGNGQPKISTRDGRYRQLGKGAVWLDASILTQRRDPEEYPELAFLADTYERWRIYREWTFGKDTPLRNPQPSDARNDLLEEDFSNLGVFLSRLRKSPAAKRAILHGLGDLYESFSDFDCIVEGGTVQVHFTEDDIPVPATRLSDGTLRYLCLLAILCDPAPPPLVCIEEPELGLHPDILPKLADLLVAASQRTQLFVTTHSDILVDAMTERPEAVVICEKHEGQTEMRRLERASLAKWLDKYRLGQLWTRGELGGVRW